MISSHIGESFLSHDHSVDADVFASELSGGGVLLVHGAIPVPDVGNRGLEAVDRSCLDAISRSVRTKAVAWNVLRLTCR